MKITTFSVVIGTESCDAHCPFCVSHMTGFSELGCCDTTNDRNLRKAIMLAERGGCTTALLTGKGEPTLYPEQVLEFVEKLNPHFPLVELQTNAIRIGDAAVGENDELDEYVERWLRAGLNTIAISVVDVEPDPNKKTYLHHRERQYPDLSRTTEYLHHLGYAVRLCVMAMHPYVDSVEGYVRVVNWCKSHEVEQLTIRPIRRPVSVGMAIDEASYVGIHGLSGDEEFAIHQDIESSSTRILRIGEDGHAFNVFDVYGQNLALPDCLTVDGDSDSIRTLIFYPDGRLTYDWQHKGARLL